MFLPIVLPLVPQDGSVTFLDRTVTLPEGTFAYQVYIPKGGRGKRPAILFLHGAGERGEDNRAQTKNAVPAFIARERGRFPAILVAPQCRTNRWWGEPEMMRMALAAFEASTGEFNGDPERRYLTGLSMGGYGTWAIAVQDPKPWAAIAPVCGGLARPGQRVTIERQEDPYAAAARAIRALPVWAFHGEIDPVVPVSESRQMVAALFAQGARVKYSEYLGVGHNSWDAAYGEPKLLSWFLSHRRGKPGR